MAGKVESELKFTFAPEALPRVRAVLDKETDGSPERRRLVSSYFDTDDDYLWRHAATLRLRDDGEHSSADAEASAGVGPKQGRI